MLIADVSELSVGSILIGRWMRNDWGLGVRCIYTEKVYSWEVVGPMGGEWLMEVDTSSVRWRGGKRVYKSSCSGITVLRLGWLGTLCHVCRAVFCSSIYVVVAARTYWDWNLLPCWCYWDESQFHAFVNMANVLQYVKVTDCPCARREGVWVSDSVASTQSWPRG